VVKRLMNERGERRRRKKKNQDKKIHLVSHVLFFFLSV
jgi:hypothetical protein